MMVPLITVYTPSPAMRDALIRWARDLGVFPSWDSAMGRTDDRARWIFKDKDAACYRMLTTGASKATFTQEEWAAVFT